MNRPKHLARLLALLPPIPIPKDPAFTKAIGQIGDSRLSSMCQTLMANPPAPVPLRRLFGATDVHPDEQEP